MLHKFKVDIMLMARQHEKEIVLKHLVVIHDHGRALQKVNVNVHMPAHINVQEAMPLTKHIHKLTQRQFQQQQQRLGATYRLLGNKPTNYWLEPHRK